MARNFVCDLSQTSRKVRFLVRDRDTKFTAAFDEVLGIEGNQGRPHAGASAPGERVNAERWIESLHTECLDDLLIFSRRQLERVRRAYVAHYNTARPHRGLLLEFSEPGIAPLLVGTVERHDILGGLIHEYCRAA